MSCYLPFNSCPLHISWILWTIFIKLHSNVPFSEMMHTTWPAYLDPRPWSQVKVNGFTLELCVLSISPEPLGWFSLNFTQMFLSVRRCAKQMNQLTRIKFKATGQGHVVYPSICARSLSRILFIKIHSNVFLSETMCRAHDPATKTQGHGHRSRSNDLPLYFMFALYLLNP